jgi:hypothetical protein
MNETCINTQSQEQKNKMNQSNFQSTAIRGGNEAKPLTKLGSFLSRLGINNKDNISNKEKTINNKDYINYKDNNDKDNINYRDMYNLPPTPTAPDYVLPLNNNSRIEINQNQVKKLETNIQKFKGGPNEDVEDWIFAMEQAFFRAQIGYHDRLSHSILYVENLPFTIIKDYIQKGRTWNEYVAELRKMYRKADAEKRRHSFSVIP